MMSRSRLSAFGRCAAQLCAAIGLVATVSCGGGGGAVPGVGGQGTGTSGEQSGLITGLGSVVVEGVRYEEGAGTQRLQDLDPAQPASVTTAAVKVGMITRLGFDDAQVITQLRVTPALIGSIERRSADALVVAGQTVRVQSTGALPVVFEGLADFSELAVADRVEVHGHLDGSGQILASRIARIDAASPAQTRVTGLIGAVENAGQVLRIGELSVDLVAATTLLPAGASLAVGQQVVVWADASATLGRLRARTIAQDGALSGSAIARTGGVIRGFDRATNRFRIDAILVDVSGTVRYQNGSAADLADGKVVRVNGLAGAGALKASELEFLRDGADAPVQLTGVISGLLSAASLQIRGVTIDAGGLATDYRNGSAANLANGSLVKIDGRIVGGTVRADRVEFIVTEDSRAQAFRGLISDFDPVSASFHLLGIAMRLSSTATISGNGGNLLPRSAFGNGLTATVTGSYASGQFVATAAQLRTDSNTEVVKSEGLAYLVDLALQRLHVNGISVRWTAATRIDGNIGDLRPGVNVRVEGSIVADELVATRLTLRP